MATEANCRRSVITSLLITLFVALMLIILYLYHQLDNCRYDSNKKKILTFTIILILMILTLIQMTP